MSIIKRIVLFYVLTFTNPAFAQVGNIKMSDGEIFNRCYVKMFKAVVPRTASLGTSLLADVLAKKITGPEACMVLFNQSEFVDTGILRTAKSDAYAKLTEAENQALISNFHNFHNTWFSKKALDFAGADNDSTTYTVRDSDEASLYLTRALFSKAIDLSTFFTAKTTLRGVRVAAGGVNATSRLQSKPVTVINEAKYKLSNPGILLMSVGLNNESLSSIPLSDSSIVPFGKLVGVEEVPSMVISNVFIRGPNINIISGDSSLRADMNAAIAAKRASVDFFEHLGGGVLGSQTYIMKNTNLGLFQVAPNVANNPDDLIARRISSRVFKDLLCHQLPTLTEADVVNDVRIPSTHGFRLSTSCMACHSSIDPMAYAFRNFASYVTSTNGSVADNLSADATRAMGTPFIGFTKLAEKPGTKLFTLQAPTGSLNYRDHNNNLIKKPVTGLDELGLELSKSDDFYRCVTKRYYEFFTGHNVALAERTVAEANNTNTAKFHREKVYAIAARLKVSQSLPKMVEEIISSEGFIYRQYQVP